jgi:hypothetical protein
MLKLTTIRPLFHMRLPAAGDHMAGTTPVHIKSGPGVDQTRLETQGENTLA